MFGHRPTFVLALAIGKHGASCDLPVHAICSRYLQRVCALNDLNLHTCIHLGLRVHAYTTTPCACMNRLLNKVSSLAVADVVNFETDVQERHIY